MAESKRQQSGIWGEEVREWRTQCRAGRMGHVCEEEAKKGKGWRGRRQQLLADSGLEGLLTTPLCLTAMLASPA